MYKSIQGNSSNEQFLDKYICVDTDPETHGRLRFFIRAAKGSTNSRF